MTLLNWDASKGDPNKYKLGFTEFFVDWKAIDESIVELDGRHYFEFSDEDEVKSRELIEQQKEIDKARKKEWDEKLASGMPISLKNNYKKLSLHGDFRCNYHVATVGNLELQQAISLLHLKNEKNEDEHWYGFEPQTLTIRIQYPLSKTVEFKVPSYKRIYTPGAQFKKRKRWERDCMDPGYIMWVVAQMYKRIYDKYEHYGVWGHVMGDLYFESFNINWDGKTALHIGS